MTSLLLGLALTLQPPDDAFTRTVTVEHHVRATASSRATEDAELRRVEVVMALPPSDARQKIGRIRFEPQPDEIVELEDGERLARWHLPVLPTGERRVFRWTAEVSTRDVHPGASTSAEALANPTRWLRSRPWLDMDSDRLRALARELREAHENDEELLRGILGAIKKHLTYRLDGIWRSPREVLSDGHASCSEYTFLLVSLARLCGLPARAVGGTAYRGKADEAYVDRIQHRWAEVWLSGRGWTTVDASGLDGEPTAVLPLGVGVTSHRLLLLSRDRDDARLGRQYVARSSARLFEGALRRAFTRVHWHARASEAAAARPSSPLLP